MFFTNSLPSLLPFQHILFTPSSKFANSSSYSNSPVWEISLSKRSLLKRRVKSDLPSLGMNSFTQTSSLNNIFDEKYLTMLPKSTIFCLQPNFLTSTYLELKLTLKARVVPPNYFLFLLLTSPVGFFV